MTSKPSANAPDVRQLAADDLSKTDFPGGRKQSFRVYFEPAVHEGIWKHGKENMGVEICGVLVGKWAIDADGPFVLVSESIRGDAATNKFAEVTFTHETWAKINEQMDSKFATLKIVGWYHSHPDFGVFLSDRDRFIQENFFSGPGQVAMVVDPVRNTEGVFVWGQGKPTLTPHYWVGDRVQVATAAGKEVATPASSAVASSSAAAGQAGPAVADGRFDWVSLANHLVICILVFALGFLLAGKLTDLERFRIEQRADERALGRYTFGKIRPGLREELSQVQSSLLTIAKAANVLAKDHLRLVKQDKEAKSLWAKGIGLPIEDSIKRLVLMQERYCLTEKEMEFLGVEPQRKPDKSTNKKSKTKKGDSAPTKDKKKKAQ